MTGIWAFHPFDLALEVLHFMVFLKLGEKLVSLDVRIVGEVLRTVRVPADPLVGRQVWWQLLAKFFGLTLDARDEHMWRVYELVRAR